MGRALCRRGIVRQPTDYFNLCQEVKVRVFSAALQFLLALLLPAVIK